MNDPRLLREIIVAIWIVVFSATCALPWPVLPTEPNPLPSSATIALLVIVPYALFVVIWYVLAGRRPFQVGRREGKMAPQQS